MANYQCWNYAWWTLHFCCATTKVSDGPPEPPDLGWQPEIFNLLAWNCSVFRLFAWVFCILAHIYRGFLSVERAAGPLGGRRWRFTCMNRHMNMPPTHFCRQKDRKDSISWRQRGRCGPDEIPLLKKLHIPNSYYHAPNLISDSDENHMMLN